jgi:protein tyrosine/serine phosphatase
LKLKKRMAWLIWIAILLIVAGFSYWKVRLDTYHLATVQDGVLYRDGVRTQRQFENTVRKVKPKTVVRLIDQTEEQKEPFTSEAAFCQSHNIAMVSIPIKLGGWPTSDQVRQFLDVVKDPSRRPVLVHCAQGVRRTGMMVAAYERSALGWDAKKSSDNMLTFGHSERTIKDVQKFINVYDPQTGTVPEGLPVGQE